MNCIAILLAAQKKCWCFFFERGDGSWTFVYCFYH